MHVKKRININTPIPSDLEARSKKVEIVGISLFGQSARTSNSYGRNLPYMRYRVFITRKAEDGESYQRELSDVFTAEELKSLSYWSPRSLAMAMTCWGTSQSFEAQIALGRWLGWSDKDWSAFSRKCEEFIKVN